MLQVKKTEDKFLKEINNLPEMKDYGKRAKQFYHNVYWAVKRGLDRVYNILDTEESTSSAYNHALLMLENEDALLKTCTKNIFSEIYLPKKIESGFQATMYLKAFYMIPESDRNAIMRLALRDAMKNTLKH